MTEITKAKLLKQMRADYAAAEKWEKKSGSSVRRQFSLRVRIADLEKKWKHEIQEYKDCIKKYRHHFRKWKKLKDALKEA